MRGPRFYFGIRQANGRIMVGSAYELMSFSSNLFAILPAVNIVPGGAENISCSLTL